MAVIETNPPSYLEIPTDAEVAFIAGPIQGAPDWQTQSINIMREQSLVTDLYVANPVSEVFNDYDTQVDWEQYHLRRAAKLGGILFWFAAQTPDSPRPNKPGRSYAQTTRIEFGKVTEMLETRPHMPVAIGIEEGYEGSEKYFRKDARKYNIPIQDSIDETTYYLIDRIGL